MKKVSLIIGILIILDIIYIVLVNQGQSLNVVLFPGTKPINMNSAIALGSLALYTALGTFLVTSYKLIELTERLKKQTRNIEKASIISEESSDKAKALQAKVETLEAALKEALKK